MQIESAKVVGDAVGENRWAAALIENQIDARYITSAELAAYLGLSLHTIRAWRKFHVITPIRFGRAIRWLLKDVLEELAKRRHPNAKS